MFDPAGADLAVERGNVLLDQILVDEAAIATLQARQLYALAELTNCAAAWTPPRDGAGPLSGGPADMAAAELGPAMRLSRRSAVNRVGFAADVCDRLPASVEQLAAGQITMAKLRILAEHTQGLDRAVAARVEGRALGRAARQTPAQLGRSLARAVLAADPDTARRRAECAVRERDVTFAPAADGMAWLSAYLPAADALRAYDVLARVAKQAKTPGDPRTAGARRADTLVDILLGDTDVRHSTTVHVTMPITALAEPGGADSKVDAAAASEAAAGTAHGSDRAADLDGYGPITAEAAEDLLAHSTIRRIVTDPLTGSVLDVGTRTYTPPAALRRHVQLRDKHCRFPGCRRPAVACDLDHSVPYPEGPTSEGNLAGLCRTHHRHKTHSRWQVEHLPGAVLRWTSPLGRRYRTYPWDYATDDDGEPPPGRDHDALATVS